MGTFVEIQAWHADEDLALEAIQAAFDAIQKVEEEMSFHDPESALSQLNRKAFTQPVTVSPEFYQVLEFAQFLYLETAGLFDLSIGSELVEWGELPEHTFLEKGRGKGKNILLLPHNQIRFSAPLQLDLGGIAKGFAVDQAIAALQHYTLDNGLVNAGGDLRFFGTEDPRVGFRHPALQHQSVSFTELKKKAMATSTPSKKSDTESGSVHINGQTRAPLSKSITVSVFADTCMVADALTKIVTLLEDQAEPILDKLSALAFITQEDL